MSWKVSTVRDTVCYEIGKSSGKVALRKFLYGMKESTLYDEWRTEDDYYSRKNYVLTSVLPHKIVGMKPINRNVTDLSSGYGNLTMNIVVLNLMTAYCSCYERAVSWCTCNELTQVVKRALYDKRELHKAYFTSMLYRKGYAFEFQLSDILDKLNFKTKLIIVGGAANLEKKRVEEFREWVCVPDTSENWRIYYDQVSK